MAKINLSLLPNQTEKMEQNKKFDVERGVEGAKEALGGLAKRIGETAKGEFGRATDIAGEAREKFKKGEFVEGAAKTFAAGTKALFSPVAGVFGGISQPAVEDFGKAVSEKLSDSDKAELGRLFKKAQEFGENLPSEVETALQVGGALFEIIGTVEGGRVVKDFVSDVVGRGVDVSKKSLNKINKFTFKTGRTIQIPRVGQAKPKVSDTIPMSGVEKSSFRESAKSFIDKKTEQLLFADLKDPVDITFRAIKPRIIKGVNLKKVKDNYKFANQTLVDFGFQPTDLKTYVSSIDTVKRKIWSKIEGKIKEGEGNLDLTPIALKLLEKSEDVALLRVNPRGAKQIEEFAENLVRIGGEVNIVDGERMKQMLNAQLDELTFSRPDISQPLKEAMKDVTVDIGDQLDVILSIVPDEFSDLKRQYGALRGIEEDVVKRMIVFERQNPEDLIGSLTKIQAVGDIVFGSVGERAKAVQRLTVSKIIKDRNDANKMIKRAFELTKPIRSNDAVQSNPRIAVPPIIGQGTP